ncbi:MAG TPA: response regulator [Thermomicrobiales bacterium]|jgi:CheY-like chemotaxis protein|nr:response regulator [Thermomicrobiales bacterium]
MHRILVVDDEPTICEFIQEFLEDEGYWPVCAHNGAEALQHIHRTRPDLVLMDIMMPGLDGREVVRQLQEHPTYSAIPVILMSAAVRWDEAVDGPIQFISKPFDLERLLRMINQTISHSPGGSSGESGGSGRMAKAPETRRPDPMPPSPPTYSSIRRSGGSFGLVGA